MGKTTGMDDRGSSKDFESKKPRTKEQIRADGLKALREASSASHRTWSVRAVLLPVLVVAAIAAAFVAITVMSPHHKTLRTLALDAVRDKVTVDKWHRPTNQQAQAAAAGMSLTPDEQLAVHYHSHLDVYVDGKHVTVPAYLGIAVTAKGAPEHGQSGLAALHTHDTSGILHVEAPAKAKYTLGQALTEWGLYSAKGQVGSYQDGHDGVSVTTYVNGNKVGDGPSSVVLKDHEEIAVVITTKPGQPSVKVPASYKFPDELLKK